MLKWYSKTLQITPDYQTLLFFIGIPEAGEEHQILVHWLVMKEMINLAEMYTK